MTVKSVNPLTGGKPMQGAEWFATLKDSQGRFRTQSLFWEKRHPDYSAPFTLKKRPHKGRISMYEKYMEIGDPTEYTQAITMLGSWDHWKRLAAQPWFLEYLNEWREELKVRMESDRFLEMKDLADNHAGTPQGISATKWLADRYGDTKKPKRGRPSKAEKDGHLKQLSKEEEMAAEDAARLGL